MIDSKQRWSRRGLLKMGAGAAAVAFFPRVGMAGDGWDAVRSAVNDGVGEGGASLLVLTRDRQLFREAFGSTLIQIPGMLASASMGPSAAAILALAARDVVGLDDSLGTFIKLFDGDKGAITIRQCLAHTSGIADPGNLLTPPVKDPGISLEEEVDRAARKALATEPGTVFSPGGMSYQAAGRAAELASGTAWELLFQQEIDEPLGANFTFGETSDPRLAAGASASIDSFGAVLQMLLNDGKLKGVRILARSLVKELRTNQVGGVDRATPGPSLDTPTGYGLGWWLEEMNEKGVADRINAASSNGTVPWIDFAKGYAAVLLLNADERTGKDLYAKIRPLIETALR